MKVYRYKPKPRNTAADLMRRVEFEPNSGCWLWSGHIAPDGYGRVNWENRATAAHKTFYRLFVGEIPDGLWVLHRCDTPACVRPDHLFLGTALDNATDRSAKGRSSRGERHPSRKLSCADVNEIRGLAASGVSVKVIAEKFGVAHCVAYRAIVGRSWAWLKTDNAPLPSVPRAAPVRDLARALTRPIAQTSLNAVAILERAR